MKELLFRFSADAIKFDKYVAAGMVLAWATVLLCAVHSILGQNYNKRQRIFWIALVVLLPLAGVLIYLPFCLKLEDYPHLTMWKKRKS